MLTFVTTGYGPQILNFKSNSENLQIESNPKSCELKSNLQWPNQIAQSIKIAIQIELRF